MCLTNHYEYEAKESTMSNQSPPLTESQPATDGHSIGRRLLDPVRGVAFWAAIALPFVQVPLVLSGLDEKTTVVAFVGLLVLNIFALYVGHTYHRT